MLLRAFRHFLHYPVFWLIMHVHAIGPSVAMCSAGSQPQSQRPTPTRLPIYTARWRRACGRLRCLPLLFFSAPNSADGDSDFDLEAVSTSKVDKDGNFSNWASTAQSTPAKVLTPKTAEDVQNILHEVTKTCVQHDVALVLMYAGLLGCGLPAASPGLFFFFPFGVSLLRPADVFSAGERGAGDETAVVMEEEADRRLRWRRGASGWP